MSGIKASTALQAVGAQTPIALNAQGEPPEWIMLLPTPKDGIILTVDGRGPYRVADPARLAAHSMDAARVPLPIDENHSTDLAAPDGRPSPARAWITALEARDGGIYGRVDWTESGKQLIADKAYRGISPVFMHDTGKTVLRILRASLCNNPNLRDIAALQTETIMDLLAQLRLALGLADSADASAVVAKVNELKGGTALQSVALAAGLAETASIAALVAGVKALKIAPQAALAPIAKAAGLKDDADAAAVLAAVTTLAASKPDAGAITALQSELKTVTTELNSLKTDGAKARATAYVDAEIARGRVGVKPLRDHYIAMHATDAARVEKEIGAMPVLGPSGALQTPPASKDGKTSLNAEQSQAAKLLGIKPEDYAKTLAAEQAADAAA